MAGGVALVGLRARALAAGADGGGRGGWDEAAGGGKRARKPYVKFSQEVERAILRRVALGEPVTKVCQAPGMPTQGTVSAWARDCERFGKALRRAKAAAGWTTTKHPGPEYCEVQAMEIYARLCEGESLKSICQDPEMPGHSTVYRWRQRFPEFAATIRAAREVQAEMFCDEGVEIMRGATPETAYLAHVQLGHLRWTAATQAPKRFGRFRPVTWEDEAAAVGAAAAEPTEVVFRIRQFEKVTGPDGKVFVREVPEASTLTAPRPAGAWLRTGSGADSC